MILVFFYKDSNIAQEKEYICSIMNKFDNLLKTLTVDSKDNGKEFVTFDRVNAIKALLEGSDFKLQHEGPLSLVYARHELAEDEDIVLITTHIDCLHTRCFCEEQEECYKGTFDNSITNAAVIYNMLHDQFNDNVVVAFTGDEEKDCHGLDEAVNFLEQEKNCYIRFALVAEVTSEGWEEKCPFVIENDFHVDMFTAHRVVDALVENFDFLFVHNAEPDESWDLDEMEIPCFTMSLPVHGDMHSDAGVLARKESIPSYCCALAAAAVLVSAQEAGEAYEDADNE